MTIPPDELLFPMVPNPEKGKKRRSHKEEERRQGAVRDSMVRQARAAGIEITEVGRVDPLAAPNVDRAEAIKADTQPKLVKASLSFERTFVSDEVHTPDGTIRKRVKTRMAAEAKLSANCRDLVEMLVEKLDQYASSVKDGVSIAVRVVSGWIGSITASGSSARNVVITPEPVEVVLETLGSTMVGMDEIRGRAAGTSTASASPTDSGHPTGRRLQAEPGTFEVRGDDIPPGGLEGMTRTWGPVDR